MFFLHAWSQEMANGLTNQYSLIIKSFGFLVLQTTLLGCVTGICNFFSLAIAAGLLACTKVGSMFKLLNNGRSLQELTNHRTLELGYQQSHILDRHCPVSSHLVYSPQLPSEGNARRLILIDSSTMVE